MLSEAKDLTIGRLHVLQSLGDRRSEDGQAQFERRAGSETSLASLGMTTQKYLEFSNEPPNIRYGEAGRRRDLSCQKKIDRLNKCSS